MMPTQTPGSEVPVSSSAETAAPSAWADALADPAVPLDLTGKRLHFVGIGGCGMSGLARMAAKRGACCTGSDLGMSKTVGQLRAAGIPVSLEQDGSAVPGELDLLVATTVIEVGVNVPNASIMVIERAEIFGLAQLHQLRGRVGRGAAASTCLLMYQPPLSETGQRRLTTLRDTEDGFRISEVDLQMRGAGDLIGTAQSGLPRFRIADMERQADLMATAQTDARALLTTDPHLTSDRGKSARTLLWLMEQDQAIRLISVG